MPKSIADLTEPELRELLNAMGDQVQMTAAMRDVEKPLFMLLIFNHPRFTQYVSNCPREDMLTMLRETAARFQSGQGVPR